MAKAKAAPAGLVIPEGVKFLALALGRLALAKLTDWLNSHGEQLRAAAQEEVRAQIAAETTTAAPPPA